ncbi:phosphotransferase [Halopseudomonas pachastrellae]|nr:phosphotransferase [Halopseudomonas pachastrellae]
MREYPGQTLEEHKRQHGLLSISACRTLAAQLLRAVGKLHQRNLIHCDIKPDNLLLGDDERLRLLDFGLCYCPGLSTASRVSAGYTQLYGTRNPRGAAPTPAQDIYACGVTLTIC